MGPYGSYQNSWRRPVALAGELAVDCSHQPWHLAPCLEIFSGTRSDSSLRAHPLSRM